MVKRCIRGLSFLLVLVLACFISCTRQVTELSLDKSLPSRFSVREEGDTISYKVEFTDEDERERFVGAFQAFLGKYPFGTFRIDTIENYFSLRLVPPPEPKPPSDSIPLTKIEREEIIEAAITEALDSTIQLERLPRTGGSITFYSDRACLDEPLASLVRASAFDRQRVRPRDTVESDTADVGRHDFAIIPGGSYITASVVHEKKVTLRFDNDIRDGAGQALSAFDIVNYWTAFVRDHPAEGLVLFRHVRGIVPFIQGREAVIRGLVVADEVTVNVMLENADPDVLTRLDTPRLLPGSFKMGQYWIAEADDRALVLLPNKNHPGGKPFLDKCVIDLAADKNPLLSFSMGKLDGMMIVFRKDVEYARAKMMSSARLVILGHDRYFISVGGESEQLREYLCGVIDAGDILDNFVRAQGRLISAIESDTAGVIRTGAMPAPGTPPSVNRPLRIVYRKDDPVSLRIAQKLLADLTRPGLSCALAGETCTDYEKSMIAGHYDLAVGWTTGDVLSDRAEKLRLQTIWFADRDDESRRIDEHFEAPLFEIERFGLFKNDVALYQGRFSGIYRDRER